MKKLIVGLLLVTTLHAAQQAPKPETQQMERNAKTQERRSFCLQCCTCRRALACAACCVCHVVAWSDLYNERSLNFLTSTVVVMDGMIVEIGSMFLWHAYALTQMPAYYMCAAPGIEFEDWLGGENDKTWEYRHRSALQRKMCSESRRSNYRGWKDYEDAKAYNRRRPYFYKMFRSEETDDVKALLGTRKK